MSTTQMFCCNGHPIVKHKLKLRQYQGFVHSRQCNLCNASIPRDKSHWRCDHQCHYDVCEKCFDAHWKTVISQAETSGDQSLWYDVVSTVPVEKRGSLVPHLPSAFEPSPRGAPEPKRTSVLEIAESESLDWLNTLLKGIWPKANQAVQKIIHEKVEPQIQEKLPSALKGIHFAKFDLGDQTPTLGPVKVYNIDGGMKLHIGLDYTSDVFIELQAGPVSIGVKSLQLSGELVVRFEQLIDEMPIVGGIVVYFLSPPRLDIEFTGVGKVVDCPGIAGIIRNAVDSAIADAVVIPNQIATPLATEDQGVDLALMKIPRPKGLLKVFVRKATGLRGADVALLSEKTSDPYVQVKLGKETWKSSIVKKNCDPVWPEDEHGYLFVYDREQQLQISVFDEDLFSSDDLLGEALGIKVGRALELQGDRSIQLYPKAADVDEDASGPGCGELIVDFQFYELVKKELCGDVFVLKIKVDEIFLPTSAGSEAMVTAELNGLKQSTPVGVASPKIAAVAVSEVLEGVINRLNDMDMSVNDIAKATALPLTDVAAVIAGDMGKEAKEHVVEVEASIFFVVPTALITSGSLKLNIASQRGKVIASSSICLSDVAASADHELPGPLDVPCRHGHIRAQIGVALLGTKMRAMPQAALTRMGSQVTKPVRERTEGTDATISQDLLSVRVVRANGLRNTDRGLFRRGGDVSDPYAVVSIGAINVKTETVWNNLNPEWSSGIFRFALSAGDQKLVKIQVFDCDLVTKDELLGEAMLDISNYDLGDALPYMCTESLGDGNGTITVELSLNQTDGAGLDHARAGADALEKIQLKERKVAEERAQAGAGDVVAVSILAAHGLRNTDRGLFRRGSDKSDPYAVASIGSTKFSTGTIKDCLDPVWNSDTFFLTLQHSGDLLKIVVFDEDLLVPDETLGAIEVSVGDLSFGEWHARRESLGEGNGEIEFKVRLERQQSTRIGKITEKGQLLQDSQADANAHARQGALVGAGKTVSVRVIAGFSLRNGENRISAMLGKVSDPYVMLSLGSTKRWTKTVMNSLDPVWNSDEFPFSVSGDEKGHLELEVFDWDLLKYDDSIGKTIVDIEQLALGEWIRLKESLGEGNGHLALEIRVELQPSHRVQAVRAEAEILEEKDVQAREQEKQAAEKS